MTDQIAKWPSYLIRMMDDIAAMNKSEQKPKWQIYLIRFTRDMPEAGRMAGECLKVTGGTANACSEYAEVFDHDTSTWGSYRHLPETFI